MITLVELHELMRKNFFNSVTDINRSRGSFAVYDGNHVFVFRECHSFFKVTDGHRIVFNFTDCHITKGLLSCRPAYAQLFYNSVKVGRVEIRLDEF